MNPVDELLSLHFKYVDLSESNVHGESLKEFKRYQELKKQVSVDIDRVEEYKQCKQYWYDLVQKIKREALTLDDDDGEGYAKGLILSVIDEARKS